MTATVRYRIVSRRAVCLLMSSMKHAKQKLFFFYRNTETWSLLLWREHKLRLCERRVLRKYFGLTKREEVTGVRKSLNIGNMRNVYSGTGERKINAQRDLIERRPLEICSRIWEDTIKIDL